MKRRPPSSGRDWVLRCTVLVALALTLWLAGPRASAIIANRLRVDAPAGPPVELGRVGYLQMPAWLRNPDLLLAVMEDLEPRLEGSAAVMDEVAATELMARLDASAWVREVSLSRVFPDRFRVSLTLRRPVLEVHLEPAGFPVAGRPPAGQLIALSDRDGICLPPVNGLELPRTVMSGRRPPSHTAPAMGEPHPDPAVAAASQVAVEWQERVEPALPTAPRLAEVDAGNVGYRLLADGRHPEVQVILERSDGEMVPLAYGHHPHSRYTRLPMDVKIEVLRKILTAHPGLQGVTGGDLRFANRWEQYIRPYRGAGPWGDLDR